MKNKRGQIQATEEVPVPEVSGALVEASSVEAPAAAPVSTAKPKKSKKWLWWVLGGIVVVAIIIVVVWMLMGGGEGSVAGAASNVAKSEVPTPPALPN